MSHLPGCIGVSDGSGSKNIQLTADLLHAGSIFVLNDTQQAATRLKVLEPKKWQRVKHVFEAIEKSSQNEMRHFIAVLPSEDFDGFLQFLSRGRYNLIFWSLGKTTKGTW